MPDNAVHFILIGLKIVENFLDNLKRRKRGKKTRKRHMQLVICRSS